MRLAIKHLEMHIAHDCNLSCTYCHHYCDFGYKGIIPFAEGGGWIREWSKRLDPAWFRLLGGEPLLNPELREYVECAAACFPRAKRDVVTNGLLLRRVEHLLPLFVETGTMVSVSLHPVADKRHEAAINDALVLLHQWRERGLAVDVAAMNRWEKYYLGEGEDIRPYQDNDPDKSRENCPWHKHCTTIHQGKLYECLHLAYLPMIADRLAHRELWEPYLAYRPLDVTASDDELEAFLGNSDFWYCGQCSAAGPALVERPGTYPDDIIGRLLKNIPPPAPPAPPPKKHKAMKKAARERWRKGERLAALGYYGAYVMHKILKE